jgi:hypothetical protein
VSVESRLANFRAIAGGGHIRLDRLDLDSLERAINAEVAALRERVAELEGFIGRMVVAHHEDRGHTGSFESCGSTICRETAGVLGAAALPPADGADIKRGEVS